MKDEPRKASIHTAVDTDCYTLDRHNFVTLLGPLRDVLEQNIGMTVLKSVQLLKSLSPRQLKTVSRVIDRRTFQDGGVLIREGDAAARSQVRRLWRVGAYKCGYGWWP